MGIVDTLLDTARADTELLFLNDRHGDVLSKPRVVTFLLLAPDRAKADLVASFIDDNRYGATRVEPMDEKWGVFVEINMPIEQNVICSVSGLMACIAAVFSIEYDGWESLVQRA
jgi:hypothetical protein